MNEEEVFGIKKGGVLIVVCFEVELNVIVGDIFEKIVVDLVGKEVGDVLIIFVVELLVGVKLMIDCDFVIVNIFVLFFLCLFDNDEDGEGEVVEGEEVVVEE